MKSSVFELPYMVETARRVSRELGTDRYCVHVGRDFMEWNSSSEYDLAFLGNILHHFDHEGAIRLISRVGDRLKPGGVIAIWDLAQNSACAGPVSSLFSLLFHITSGAECFSEETIRTMLESCGFQEIRRIDPAGGETHFLIVAGR